MTELTVENFVQVMREEFPLRGGPVELSAPTSDPDLSSRFFEKDGMMFGTFWLMIYDENAQIRDIKEQTLLCVLDKARVPVERLRAMIQGLGLALELRAKEDRNSEWYDLAMPMDMFQWDALKLVRPMTTEDFADVFYRRWKIGPYFGLRSKPKATPDKAKAKAKAKR